MAPEKHVPTGNAANTSIRRCADGSGFRSIQGAAWNSEGWRGFSAASSERSRRAPFLKCLRRWWQQRCREARRTRSGQRATLQRIKEQSLGRDRVSSRQLHLSGRGCWLIELARRWWNSRLARRFAAGRRACLQGSAAYDRTSRRSSRTTALTARLDSSVGVVAMSVATLLHPATLGRWGWLRGEPHRSSHSGVR
ncbi:hypothetical protein MRX96_007540 [Rhipicephalus microplus]